MACRLFGAKPLSEPMMTYCQLNPVFLFNKILCETNKDFIQGNAFENAVWKMGTILSRPHSVNHVRGCESNLKLLPFYHGDGCCPEYFIQVVYLTGTVLNTHRSCNIMFFSRGSKCHEHRISVAVNVFIAESGSYLIFCHLWTDRKVEQLYRHDKFYLHQLIYNIFIYKNNTSRY